MRAFLGLLFGIVLILPTTAGCGPRLTDEELGTVILDASELPGADEPYALPESGAPAASGTHPGPADES